MLMSVNLKRAIDNAVNKLIKDSNIRIIRLKKNKFKIDICDKKGNELYHVGECNLKVNDTLSISGLKIGVCFEVNRIPEKTN